jgi:hypothetical protein
MAVVLLKNLRPGMLVAEDVKDLNGNILIYKGVELEDKHEKILKSWGVSDVEILGERMDPIIFDQYLNRVDSKDLKQAQDHLNTLFSRSNTGFPPTQMLYRLCLERKLKKNN